MVNDLVRYYGFTDSICLRLTCRLAEIREIRAIAAGLVREGRRLEYTTYLAAWRALHRWARALPRLSAREYVELEGALRSNDTARFAHLLGELEERLESGSRSRL